MLSASFGGGKSMQDRTAAFWAVGLLGVAVALWTVTLAMATTASWGSMMYGQAVMRPPTATRPADDVAMVGLARIIVWVPLVGAFAFGGYWLLGRVRAAWVNHDEALAVARLRYARGEISREEFRQLESDLRGGTPSMA
jgi:uncharacterized membrane protein